jgi:hypothetical protein
MIVVFETGITCYPVFIFKKPLTYKLMRVRFTTWLSNYAEPETLGGY